MAKEKAALKGGKVISKSWYPIIATKEFDSKFLGESYVADSSLLLDTGFSINLANLTGDVRQQGVSLHFRVAEVEDNTGVAKVVGYEAAGSQLKRLVRRGVERLDDTFDCRTSEGTAVRIKPFAVTKNPTSKSRLTAVRKTLRETLEKETAKISFDSLIKAVISNELQTTLKNAAKKIIPLKALEIRMLKATETKLQKPEQKPQGDENIKA